MHTKIHVKLGIKFWDTASNSDIEIIQPFQSKTSIAIIQAP